MKTEEMEKGIVINIGEYKGDKPIEVVLRQGEAAKVQQLELKAPESRDVIGVLSTPYDWLSKRIGTIDIQQANVLVEREKCQITLTVNERDFYAKSKFTGRAEYTDTYAAFGINDPSKGWQPAKLAQFLRLNRSVFSDREQCMKLVSILKNFKAKATAEIEKQRDPSGSMADVYRCQVESSLPKSFTVNMAIFKGTAKQGFEIEFDHYISDGVVYLQLVSPGAKEMAETYRDTCIDQVIAKIKDVAPDIAILEA